MFEVLVVAAEQRFDVLVRDDDFTDDGGGRYGDDSCPGIPGRFSVLQRSAAPTSVRARVCQPYEPATLMCKSLSCLGLTLDGAPAIKSTACAVLGNAMTSRIDGSAHRIATMRSRPRAMPPCGGVPYSSASRKNPNRIFASSSEMPSRPNTRDSSAGSCIRMLPPPISDPFRTRSYALARTAPGSLSSLGLSSSIG